MDRGEDGKNELYLTIKNLLENIQLLESSILQKSETINNVTTSIDTYHNAISNHINEVLIKIIIISQSYY